VQAVNPVEQLAVHFPEPLQASPAGQAVPQEPQFELSVFSLTQSPAQLTSPARQETAQTPEPLQTFPEAQAVPQEPQLLTSDLTLAQ